MALPQQLYDKKLCPKPVVFTRNKLVVIVPTKNAAKIRTISDLTRKGVKIVIAQPGVPVGNYTVQVLQALHLYDQVMANVVSKENDVREVLAKIVLDEADAGFVYSTDAKAVAGDVKKIAIPKEAEPGPVRHLRGGEQFTSRGRARLRQEGAVKEGTGEAAGLRIPAAQVKRALLAVLVGAAAFVALAFLVLPVVAIFLHTTPGHLVDQLSSSVVEDAFVVTLETTLIAQALIVLLGTPTAYLLATRRFRARPLAITLVELPLVLPPAVAGIGLLTAFGRSGLLGTLSIPFTKTAVVMAVAFVSSPLYVRQAIAAFETVDPDLVAASRTLGAGTVRTFARVILPLARAGLAAGLALSIARGIGEFGATIMFAGSLQGVTQTVPLAIYSEFGASHFDAAVAMGAALVVFSLALLLTLRLLLSWPRSFDQILVPLRAFDLGLTLEVDRTVALVGPSGAGKSTILRAIAGLVRPREGRIEVGGEAWFDATRKIDRPVDERAVGFLFQDYALFPHLTVRQNIEFARRNKADAYLDRFRIGHLASARPTELSGESGSGSRWREPSRATRRCYCSTSRWRRSTAAPRRPCAASCKSSWPGSTSLRSSSHTTSRTQPPSRDESESSWTAAYGRSGAPRSWSRDRPTRSSRPSPGRTSCTGRSRG